MFLLLIGESKALRPPDKESFEDMIEGANCTCPNDCEETIYSQEISQARIRPKSNIFNRLSAKPNYLWKLRDLVSKDTTSESKAKKLNETIDDIEQYSSVVHFYFKQTGIVQYSRDELYGIMDLVGMSFRLHILHLYIFKNFFFIFQPPLVEL